MEAWISKNKTRNTLRSWNRHTYKLSQLHTDVIVSHMTCGLRFFGLRDNKKWYDIKWMVLDLSGSSTFANPFVSRNERYSTSYHCSAGSLNVTWSEFPVKTKRVYTRAALQESTNVIDRSKRNVLGRARSKQQLFREFSTAWQSGEGTVWMSSPSTGS